MPALLVRFPEDEKASANSLAWIIVGTWLLPTSDELIRRTVGLAAARGIRNEEQRASGGGFSLAVRLAADNVSMRKPRSSPTQIDVRHP
jgi:hypothetical protein